MVSEYPSYISLKRSSHKARDETVTRGRTLTKRRYAGINNKEVEGKCRWTRNYGGGVKMHRWTILRFE